MKICFVSVSRTGRFNLSNYIINSLYTYKIVGLICFAFAVTHLSHEDYNNDTNVTILKYSESLTTYFNIK